MDAETIPIPQPPSPSSPLADRFVNAAPFLRAPERVRSIYTVTLLTACGPLVAGIVFFGWRAAILAGLSVATSVLLEHVYFRITRSPAMLGRSHAYLTGLLLALTLPAHAPWYVPVVGAAFAVIIGKAVFGGVGHFVWQPALVGRVAVAVMFAAVLNPSARTADAHRTLPAPGYGLLLGPTEIISGDIHLKRRAEGYDSWTDLRNRRGMAGADAMEVRRPDAVLAGLTDPDGPHYSGLATHADAAAPYPVVMAHLPPLGDLLTGARPGGIGETCAMIIVVCGVYLIYRNYIKWQLPVAMILTAAVVAALAPIHLTANPESLGAWRMFPVAIEGPDVGITYVFCQLLSCELLLAAFFFATEMTSRPITTGGQVIFAMGCGLIGMVLKLYVDMPIPFYAAVLIMNTFSLRLDSIWHPWHSIQRDPEPSAARAD